MTVFILTGGCCEKGVLGSRCHSEQKEKKKKTCHPGAYILVEADTQRQNMLDDVLYSDDILANYCYVTN